MLLSRQVPSSDSSNPWSTLCYGGSNGFLMVLIGLSWWVQALNGRVEEEWLVQAIDDVYWVLSSMVTYLRLAKGSGGSDSSRNLLPNVPSGHGSNDIYVQNANSKAVSSPLSSLGKRRFDGSKDDRNKGLGEYSGEAKRYV